MYMIVRVCTSVCICIYIYIYIYVYIWVYTLFKYIDLYIEYIYINCDVPAAAAWHTALRV